MTTVRALCERAFDAAGVGLAWEGEAEDEKGYDAGTGDCLIEGNPRYYRPTEVDLLQGDAAKAHERKKSNYVLNMNNCIDGKNVIFLVSQPRSGSTLLQHLLGGHSRIHTAPEPWIMLMLAQGLRDSADSRADYNLDYAKIALDDFLCSLPNGKKAYQQAIRGAALHLYGQALDNRAEEIFLDKTPRYYHILDELNYLFPDSRFVLLVRNPIAVFASILDTNMNGNWRALFAHADRYHDLFTGPQRMANAIDQFGNRVAITHYETLVQSPTEEVSRICEELDIEFESAMLNYGRGPSFTDTTFIDPKSIYDHEEAVTDYINGWKKTLDTPQKIFVGRRYLEALGPELIERLGYDYDTLISEVEHLKGSDISVHIPWDLLIARRSELSLSDRLHKRFWLSLAEQGLMSTFRDVTRSLLRRLR